MLDINVDEENIEKFYKGKEIKLKDVVYKKLKTTYKQALKIMGYAQDLETGSMKLGDKAWFKLEAELFKYFTVDDIQLSKITEHFEENQDIYFQFIGYAIGIICYPFIKGNNTD